MQQAHQPDALTRCVALDAQLAQVMRNDVRWKTRSVGRLLSHPDRRIHALVPVCWGRGLGTELCHPLLAHGFTDLGLPEIVAVIDPRNTASVAPANRCGLTFRRDLTWQGQARVLHAMMRAEFEAGP